MTNCFENPFIPGSTIQLADVTELPAFETTVAEIIDPVMTQPEFDCWQGRDNVKNLIRPLKFNGKITDISLVSIENPFNALQNAKELGWDMPRGYNQNLKGSNANLEYKASRCIGFSLLANAVSSGRGVVGQIQAGLWYYPVSQNIRNGRVDKITAGHGGRSIVRVVSRPKIETENFIQLEIESNKVAYSALRKALKRPIRAGLHQ